MYCKAPYVGFGYYLNNIISPCCKYPSATEIDSNRKKISNSDLKKMFKKNVIPLQCQNCELIEQFNKYDISDSNFQDIHIQFGNLCNSQCTICTNKENENYEINNKINFDKLRMLLKNNLNYIKKIAIQGGETFLYKEKLIDIINIIKENNKLLTTIITNGTIHDIEIFEVLSKCKGLTLLISVDGNEETNHIMRPQCYMDDIKKTIKICKDFNIKFTINHTISILNVFDLEKNVTYYFEELKVPEISFNYVTTPTVLNIKYLHNIDKSKILKQLNNLKKYKIMDFARIFKLILEDNYNKNVIVKLDLFLKKKNVDHIYKVIEKYKK